MTNEIDRIITEAMGKCWHDYSQITLNGELWQCHKCGKDTSYGRRHTDYPSPSTNWKDYGEVLEWAQGEECFFDFLNSVNRDWVHQYELFNILLNPLRGSTALAEFIEANPALFGKVDV